MSRRAAGWALLTEDFEIACLLNDRTLEREVLASLGRAHLSANQPKRAIALLQQALALARDVQDRFAERIILEHLGRTHVRLGNRACLKGFHEALALARAVNDRRHEADLLWLVTIVHTALGERDQAVASAEAAVHLLQQSGNPKAAWYADATSQAPRDRSTGRRPRTPAHGRYGNASNGQIPRLWPQDSS